MQEVQVDGEEDVHDRHLLSHRLHAEFKRKYPGKQAEQFVAFKQFEHPLGHK